MTTTTDPTITERPAWATGHYIDANTRKYVGIRWERPGAAAVQIQAPEIELQTPCLTRTDVVAINDKTGAVTFTRGAPVINFQDFDLAPGEARKLAEQLIALADAVVL